MNTLLIIATLGVAPALERPVATDLAALFETQQAEVRRDLAVEIRASLAQRGQRFFSENGELQRLLAVSDVAAERLAAR